MSARRPPSIPFHTLAIDSTASVWLAMLYVNSKKTQNVSYEDPLRVSVLRAQELISSCTLMYRYIEQRSENVSSNEISVLS